MKKMKSLLLAASLCAAFSAYGQTEIPQTPEWDIYPDTWVAVDGAGRVMPGNAETGNYKYGKEHTVAIFYVTWHTANLYNRHSPYGADVTKVLEEDPNARKEKANAAWQSEYYNSYHWGEPEMGYFLSADPFVIRRDVSMLSDAGVDLLVLDVTNAVRYWDEWNALFKVLEEMKAEGNKVPQICFWSFNGQAIYVVQEIYDLFYAKGNYKDLWFMWYGKPLLLYNATPHVDANGNTKNLNNYLYDSDAVSNKNNAHYGDPLYTSQYLDDYPDYIKNFFTLRNMWWGYKNWNGKPFVGQEDNWSFGLDMGVLTGYTASQLVSKHNGEPEEYAVTPAQHASSMIGKSWTRSGGQPQLDEYDLPVAQYVESVGRKVDDPEAYGIYFQERWDEALSVNPPFIYLNDWNEFTAGKYAADVTFMRRSHNGFWFIDQYNSEFNRTIAPMKGGYTDNYYMQMAANIRKYKGSHAVPENYGLAESSIAAIDGAAWDKITVEYRDTKGDITHRDYNGYGGLRYTDNLGRNDILRTKVGVTADSIYFRVETAADLTDCSGDNWMLLFIDADNDHATGWNGYDFVLNKSISGGTSTEITKCSGEASQWTGLGASARLSISGNMLLVAVSRADLALTASNITFDFKWVDNARDFDSPIGLATAGDAAPNRRFNYRMIWHKDGQATETAQQKLINLIEEYNASKLSSNYVYGSEPGMVADSAVAAEYNNAFTDAYRKAGESLSDDEYNALYNRLQAAAEALKSAKTVPFSDGYYYIVSANSAFTSKNTVKAFNQLNATNKMLHWATLDADKPNFIYKLSGTQGGYTIQSLLSGFYINQATSDKKNSIIRLTDTIGAAQLISPLNSAGQIVISNTASSVPYYQRNGEDGITASGYVTFGEGGLSSCAAWKLVNADGYFMRNFKNPLDSVAALAAEKVSSSTVISDGKPDPLSPAYNETLKPYIDRLATLLAEDTVLDIYSITKAHIDTLAKAYDALMAIWPDSAALHKACSETVYFLTHNEHGTEPGMVRDDAYQTLENAYKSTIARRPFYALTREEIASLASELSLTLSLTAKAIALPVEGEWYNIVNADTTITSGNRPGGECVYTYSCSTASAIYWGGTPEGNSRRARSGWRFIAISDSTYAIQNTGTGWYLGGSSKEGAQLKMSEKPVEYTLKFINNRQWTLVNTARNIPLSALSKLRYISLNSDATGLNTPTSWVIKRIGKEQRDSISVTEGALAALTVPYTQTALPQTLNGEPLKLYTITGSQLSESGNTIAVELSEYRETTVPAGYPLLYIAGGEYNANSKIPVILTPETGGEVTNQALSVNGLVGVLKATVLTKDTCGYFSMQSIVPATSSYIASAQTGYVNARKIVNIEGSTADLTINITGSGLLNHISTIMHGGRARVDVYSTDGMLLRSGIEYSQALKGLAKGIYIIDRQKYIVR